MTAIYPFLKKTLFVFLLFIYVYNPPLKFLPVYPGFLISLMSFVIFIPQFLLRKQTFYSLRNLLPFLYIFLLIIFSYSIVVFHGTYEFAIGKGYILFLLAYVLGPFSILFILRKRREFDLKNILVYFIIIAVIQSLIMILMLSIPSFKDLIFSLQKDDRQILHLESGGFRMLGFAYGVVWDLGFTQSLSAIFITWLIPRLKSKKHLWLLSVSYILIFISILLSGRTGFFGVIISIVLLFYSSFIEKKNLRYYITFLLSLTLILILTTRIIYASISPEIRNLLSDRIVPWAFEMFINNKEGNGLETKSSNNLKEMYFDISFNTFLLGDGYYSDPNDKAAYYLGTDAGYMRQILFYGVFGSLFLYIFYIVIFRNIIKNVQKYQDKSSVLMFCLIAIYYFFAHIKGDIFMGGDMPLRILFLLYFLLFYAFNSKLLVNHQE